MRDFIASTNRNRKIFSDMHTAHRVSYQPFIPRRFLLRTLRLLRAVSPRNQAKNRFMSEMLQGSTNTQKMNRKKLARIPMLAFPWQGKCSP